MTEKTKKELEEEIDNLKSVLKSLSSSQIKLVENAYNIHKLVVRYQAKIHRIDSIFSRKIQICLCLLIVLIVNTILLALRWF